MGTRGRGMYGVGKGRRKRKYFEHIGGRWKGREMDEETAGKEGGGGEEGEDGRRGKQGEREEEDGGESGEVGMYKRSG